jgi:hypothetical protein
MCAAHVLEIHKLIPLPAEQVWLGIPNQQLVQVQGGCRCRCRDSGSGGGQERGASRSMGEQERRGAGVQGSRSA